MSICVYIFACQLPQARAEAFNAESARIYNMVMAEHYRVYRKKGIWLKMHAAEKLNDRYDAATPKILVASSIDAAQQAFYKACKQVHTKRKRGDVQAKFPHRRRSHRTTVWKKIGVYAIKAGILYLSQPRGKPRVQVKLPPHLTTLEKEQVLEVRLVFKEGQRRFDWHVVIEDGIQPEPVKTKRIAGIDLGEVHPAVITDGEEAVVISCRELRALNRYWHKRLGALCAKLGRHEKGSRRWRQLQARKRQFRGQYAEQKRDMHHKIAHEVVKWAQEHEIELLVIGDVRGIGTNKRRLNKKARQKLNDWQHGTVRKYIKEKAAKVGIRVYDKVDERYTTQTCPGCGKRHKPSGRIYTCPTCRAVYHRDVVGAANILSRYRYGRLGNVLPPEPEYRYPVLRGKRSPSGTGQVDRSGENRTCAECHPFWDKKRNG